MQWGLRKVEENEFRKLYSFKVAVSKPAQPLPPTEVSLYYLGMQTNFPSAPEEGPLLSWNANKPPSAPEEDPISLMIIPQTSICEKIVQNKRCN